MNIKTIVIEGKTEDISIRRTDHGAEVTVVRFSRLEGRQNRCITRIARDEDAESRFAKAAEVAKLVYGTDRRGQAAATNSMVHEVMTEIERVAGC